MVQRQNQNSRVRDSERSFNQIDVLARAGKLRHVDRKVGIRHHSRKRVHHEIGVAASCEVKREVISRIVKRTKERNALNVVEMKMTEENMRADGLVAEFSFKLISKEADSRAAIKNQNLIRVGTDFDA